MIELQPIPELRFQDFKNNWEEQQLGDLVKFTKGKELPKSDISPNGNYKCIHYGEIFTKYDELITQVVSRTNINSNPILSKSNDVLMPTSDITPNGLATASCIKEDGVILGGDILILRQEQYKIDGLFLSYYISHFKNRVMRLVSGTTVFHIYGSDLKQFELRFPSLKEQIKITSLLTLVDSRKRILKKKKNLLEQYKKGVMQKIFNQEIRFKDEDGSEFPQWKKEKLGGLTYKVGKKNKENIQFPIYSINNQEGFRPQSEQFEGLDSNVRGYDISMYKIVYEKTFAYNPARINVGSIGYSYDLNEVIISSLYVCFKTNKELEDSYLLAYLNTDRFNKDILRYQEGGVRQYLFYDNFSQIKIPLPSNEEQIKIANFLSAIDKNIELVNTKIEHTKSYKKGLLQQMFV